MLNGNLARNAMAKFFSFCNDYHNIAKEVISVSDIKREEWDPIPIELDDMTGVDEMFSICGVNCGG